MENPTAPKEKKVKTAIGVEMNGDRLARRIEKRENNEEEEKTFFR
jgi:hypothetical protein